MEELDVPRDRASGSRAESRQASGGRAYIGVVDTRARPWGPTSVPLTYSPPAADASELAIVRQETPDGPDLVRCWAQKEPARKLPNLQKVPIVVLTGEASYHVQYDHCTVKFLEQAGVQTTFIKLADIGLHGNGHMMMLEKNNLEIAAVITRWLDQTLPGGKK